MTILEKKKKKKKSKIIRIMKSKHSFNLYHSK